MTGLKINLSALKNTGKNNIGEEKEEGNKDFPFELGKNEVSTSLFGIRNTDGINTNGGESTKKSFKTENNTSIVSSQEIDDENEFNESQIRKKISLKDLKIIPKKNNEAGTIEKVKNVNTSLLENDTVYQNINVIENKTNSTPSDMINIKLVDAFSSISQTHSDIKTLTVVSEQTEKIDNSGNILLTLPKVSLSQKKNSTFLVGKNDEKDIPKDSSLNVSTEEIKTVEENKESTLEIKKENQQTINISDGDTNCSITNEKKEDIFGEYIPFFEQNTKKKQENKEKKVSIEKQTKSGEQNILTKIFSKKAEKIVKEEKIIRKEDSLETKKEEIIISAKTDSIISSTTQGNDVVKKKNKFLFPSLSVVGVIVLTVTAFMYFNNNDTLSTDLKASVVNEVQNTNNLSDNESKSENIDIANSQKQIGENNAQNNINETENMDIVKTNDMNTIENNKKTSNIDTKVKNALQKKFNLK